MQNRLIIKILLVVISCTALSAIAWGQEKRKSTEIWQSLHIKKEWSKRWKTDLRLEGRYGATNSEYETALVDVENSLEMASWLSGEVYYRYTHELDDLDRHRFALQLTGESEFNRWSVQNRIRWEWEIEDEQLSERFRWRVKPEYDAGDNEFEVFGEFFYNEEAELRQKRWGAGWTFNLTKRKSFKLRMMVDDGLRRNDFILRLAYRYELR